MRRIRQTTKTEANEGSEEPIWIRTDRESVFSSLASVRKKSRAARSNQSPRTGKSAFMIAGVANAIAPSMN
jgi:hypothetical protein